MDNAIAVTVLFGKPGAAAGWVSADALTDYPSVGMPVRIRLRSDTGDSEIEGQVYQTWGGDYDDEPGGVLVFAGLALPDDSVRTVLESAGWEPLSEDTLNWLAGSVQDSPMVAATHEVFLAVGDGENSPLRLFHQVLTPDNPALPFFGQRMKANFLNDDAVVDGILDDVWTVDDLTQSRLAFDNPELDEDFDLDEMLDLMDEYVVDLDEEETLSASEWRQEQETAREKVDKELTSGVYETSAREDGIPAVVIYASLIQVGVARLMFWTPSLGDITDEDMRQSGWMNVEIPGRFDPVEFAFRRRLELALATHVVYEVGPFAGVRLGDWWVDAPELIDESDRAYLPPYLYELAFGVRDLNSIDSVLHQWGEAS